MLTTDVESEAAALDAQIKRVSTEIAELKATRREQFRRGGNTNAFDAKLMTLGLNLESLTDARADIAGRLVEARSTERERVSIQLQRDEEAKTIQRIDCVLAAGEHMAAIAGLWKRSGGRGYQGSNSLAEVARKWPRWKEVILPMAELERQSAVERLNQLENK